MRIKSFAYGLLAAFPIFSASSVLAAAYAPPTGFTRTTQTFTGDAFAIAPDGKVAVGIANFSGGATINVYANAAAAQAAASPIRTFTDPTYKAWGDLTFTDSNTLLFSENGDKDTVYRGLIGAGTTAALAPVGSVPNAGGVVQVGSTVYAVAANNPGTGALYAITGGSAASVLTNLGVGYLSGLAVDGAGNFLLPDSNDPTFVGNAGKLLRYTSAFAPLTAVSLTGGNGSGAYDVALDSEGDTFVTTGPTITRIPFGTTTAQQFGSAFTGFPFITNLDYVGAGFEPNTGFGKLFVNAVFSDDGSIFGITPIPEPASIAGATLLGAAALLRRRRSQRRRYAGAALASLAVFATTTTSASATQFFATKVIATSPGAQQQAGFTDPTLALGGPRGGGTDQASTDVYNLGNGGSITLGFDTTSSQGHITNGPGPDFIVSENSFFQSGDVHRAFAELLYVEVSSDGVGFARFPVRSLTPAPVGPFGVIDPADVTGFAGVSPVLANIDENAINPFDPTVAGGDAFDLDYLRFKPPVLSEMVDLNNIRYVRLVDVIGGANLDSLQQPIYDPVGFGIGGADVDSVAVINGVHAPEPTLGILGMAMTLLYRNQRTPRPTALASANKTNLTPSPRCAGERVGERG